jgi:hypothetical protein
LLIDCDFFIAYDWHKIIEIIILVNFTFIVGACSL